MWLICTRHMEYNYVKGGESLKNITDETELTLDPSTAAESMSKHELATMQVSRGVNSDDETPQMSTVR